MSDNGVTERLDRLIALFELANYESLSAARAQILEDPVVSAILDTSEDWIASGALKTKVATRTSVGEKTVQRRALELLARGALEARGHSASLEYRSTGVIA